MIDPETLPSATAPVEHHADFLELSALRSQKRSVSAREYMRDLGMASATETIADSEDDDLPEEIDDQAEPLAEAAFAELDERRRSCGEAANVYPFRLYTNRVELDADSDGSLYTFLALLSWFGKDAGPAGSDGEKLFEEICAKAAEAYLGGPSELVRSFVFGFPRRVAPAGFKTALNKLCNEMGEGQGHHKGRPKLPDQKDGKLDIVAWREFEDRRQGKLITFGQCATGLNWDKKVSELPAAYDWCTNWMADRPAVWPVRSFFVPHRIDRDNWFYAGSMGGILYDRCRIASLGAAVEAGLKNEWQQWSSHVLNAIRNN